MSGLQMSQWRPPFGSYPFQEPLQHALSNQLSRLDQMPLYNLQTAYSEPPAMHAADGELAVPEKSLTLCPAPALSFLVRYMCCKCPYRPSIHDVILSFGCWCVGEQVVPQRMHAPVAEAVPSAAADWVAPPIMPQATRTSLHPQHHAVPAERPAACAAQPFRQRVSVQATADHQLAPSSPSPMEQGRVLPEFAELAPAAQPQHARDADSQQKAAYSWLSAAAEPQQGAPLVKKDLQQPLSSLESVGTPLGMHSAAQEATPVLSAGQQAESPHAHERVAQVSAAEPDLPPKKRRHVREMTPPPITSQHWAPLPMTKPAFATQRSPVGLARHHEEHLWDAVVPKRQRRHRLISGDSSSSSSAAAFEHRPVIPAEAPANAFLEAHSAPQKDHSDPLCMLLDAAEELSHHEVRAFPILLLAGAALNVVAW